MGNWVLNYRYMKTGGNMLRHKKTYYCTLQKMKKLPLYLFAGLCMATLPACTGDSNKGAQQSASKETQTSGTIDIAVDESYKPVIEQEIKVFDSSYPQAKVKASYLPESECLSRLFNGQARMILIPRELSEKEKKASESQNVFTTSMAIAADAIAVVVHPKAQDSLMTVDQLRSILTGKFARKYNVVVDNNNGSIARYISDSLTKGAPLSQQLYAAKSSDEVLKYVAEHPDALGLVGMAHTFDPNSDVGYGSFRKEVRVVAMRNDSSLKFFQPYQANIALNDYPLIRKLYFISRIDSELSSGFSNFLKTEAGQLIFTKSMMVPLAVQLVIREAEIKP